MGDDFLRCEYCGGTYSVEREWCPHCLAPRPEREVVETRADDTNAAVFYSDNVMYLTIDDEPEKKSFAELEAEMNGLNDKIDGMLAEQRGIVTTNEARDTIASSCGGDHQKKSKPVAWVEGCGPYDSPYLLKEDSNYVIGATILGFLILLLLLMLGSGVLP